MYLLTNSALIKYCRSAWRCCCYRGNPLKQVYHQSLSNNKANKLVSLKSTAECGKKYPLCTLPTLTIWTQVRHLDQKDRPKFHRDMKHPSFDDYRKEKFKDVNSTTWHSGDEKYGYTYVAGFFGFLCGMYGLKAELTHDILSMAAPADVLALASIEIDIHNIPEGVCNSYKWRGKPLFIKHRTAAEISAEANTPLTALKDPETPEQRTVRPEWLIVIGICTHLGCVPVPNSGDWAGGFYCPCHGSHYDNVGRTRKGPAPLNLEVPTYKFLSDTLVLVG